MITLTVANTQQYTIENLVMHFDRVADISLISYTNNSVEAIETIHEYQPDVVLMDIEMPVMNGIEATKVITQRFPNTKVILLIKQDDKRILNLALEAGAKGVIFKNTTVEDIEQIIRLVVKNFYQLGPILDEWNQAKPIATSLNNDIDTILDSINKLNQKMASNQQKMASIIQQQKTNSNNHNFSQKPTSNRSNYRQKYLIDLSHLKNDSFFITGFIAGVFCCAAIILLFI